ncbi:MAG: oligopeptide transporter, OPT family, partial [Gemmatimonadota bacterium]|nr:oligopeptide transporter, OPT family [Gemmatimonadota bacterium]
REEGVLFGSGLVGGGGLTGVLLAVWVGARGGRPIDGFPLSLPAIGQEALALATILAMLGTVVWHVKRRRVAD